MAQNPAQIPTTGTVTGLELVEDINGANLDFLSFLSGTSAPTASGLSAPGSTISALSGFPWHDTTLNRLNLRDQADTTWMPWATVDETKKITMPVVRGQISGCVLSNSSGSPNTEVNVAEGICCDSSNAVMISIPSGGLTINFGTTGAGGLDTGSQAASTWYKCFAIFGTTGTSVIATLASNSSPGLPSGYTYYRYLGSVWSNSSTHINPFTQTGDWFSWNTPVVAYSTTPPTSLTLETLSGVPTGSNVTAALQGNVTGAAGVFYLQDYTQSVTSSGSQIVSAPSTAEATFGRTNVVTNTSAQAYLAGTSGQTATIAVMGWTDLRGRYN